MSTSIPVSLNKRARQVDVALKRYLKNPKIFPSKLGDAMQYSVFSGGKRVRPFLAIETARLCGLTASQAMAPACAVEMIHAYSLVHDDLPAMDDDDMRRGRPTTHKKYDEATAILAGDGLMPLAFEILFKHPLAKTHPSRIIEVTRILSHAIGPHGMVGGQAADLQFQKGAKSLALIKKVNHLKTGALLEASAQIGALWAGLSGKKFHQVSIYGAKIGFLFQLVDDIIDQDGYVDLIGQEATYELAKKITLQAKKAILPFGKRGELLSRFADFLYERKK